MNCEKIQSEIDESICVYENNLSLWKYIHLIDRRLVQKQENECAEKPVLKFKLDAVKEIIRCLPLIADMQMVD